MEFSLQPIKREIELEGFNSIYYFEFGKDFSHPPERHDFWELVYVLDGTIGVAADAHVYELSKGEIVFHKPMEFHRLWAEKGSSPKLLIMSFTAEGEGMRFLENGVFHLQFDNKQAFLEMEQAVETVFSASIITVRRKLFLPLISRSKTLSLLTKETAERSSSACGRTALLPKQQRVYR